ncbi:hypothetical protein ACIRD6_34085 [Streptomyces sp. NPDC102473]|uniref:hypothetical protein n=1 Tax=Streptomyces sp. NPDC102473 TaxID=3366180 RepID=UPI003818B963
MARIQNPDAECLCDTLTARYDRLARKMKELQVRQAYADAWWRCLREAIDAHPEGRAILADAGKRAGR